jgi:SAM-dependent methyltransferase
MTTQQTDAPTTDYALGSAQAERDRLDLQGAYYRMATVDAMRWAGIGPGSSVLDLGSGTGAVAFDAARLVGPTGSVLGLDGDEVQVRTATEGAARLGLTNVRFVHADLTTYVPEAPVDAITARLITMYLRDPVGTLTRLAGAVRPGGVVLLQEFAISSAHAVPSNPLFDRMLELVLGGFRAVGAPTDLGYDLGRILRGAGLGTPTMTVGARWEDGTDAVGYALLAGVVRTLRPAIVGHGLATDAELDVDHLEGRLRAEIVEGPGTGVFAPLLVSGWAHTPA